MMLGVGEVGKTGDQAMAAVKRQIESQSIEMTSLMFCLDIPELRKSQVDVTFDQYMQPTKLYMKVERYVEPAELDR